jgi:predicted small secreted protein
MARFQPVRRRLQLLVVLVAASLSGCATVVGGGHDQKVHIDSDPPGAQVRVDGQSRGVTPTDVALNRRQEHQVQLDLPGCTPYCTTLKPGCNPWVFGNILAGGVIGLAVDASTGAMSALYPKSVKADFEHPRLSDPIEPANATAKSSTPADGIQPVSYHPTPEPNPIQ